MLKSDSITVRLGTLDMRRTGETSLKLETLWVPGAQSDPHHPTSSLYEISGGGLTESKAQVLNPWFSTSMTPSYQH